jgi:hypothetical protein
MGFVISIHNPFVATDTCYQTNLSTEPLKELGVSEESLPQSSPQVNFI